MRKHRIQVLTTLLFTLFLAVTALGCGGKKVLPSCSHPATDSTVKRIFTQKVSTVTSAPFTVNIINTETLSVPTARGISGPKDYREVTGGLKYTVEITIKAPTGSYTFLEYYEDEYTFKGTTHPATSTENFIARVNLRNLMDTFGSILSKEGIKDFVYTEDVSAPDKSAAVFLYCEDYDTINKVLTAFKNEANDTYRANNEYNSYGVYIITDKAVYDHLDTNKFINDYAPTSHGLTYGADTISVISGKKPTRIGSCTGSFDKDLFETKGAAYADTDQEYRDYNSFDYVVFWASSEPNKDGICDVQLFGVK